MPQKKLLAALFALVLLALAPLSGSQSPAQAANDTPNSAPAASQRDKEQKILWTLKGAFEEAEEGNFWKSYDSFKAALALADKDMPQHGELHLMILSNLGKIAYTVNDFQQAAAYDRRCLTIATELGEEKSPEYGPALQNLGMSLLASGNYQEGEHYSNQGALAISSHSGAFSMEFAVAITQGAEASLLLGDYEKAEKTLRTALQIYQLNGAINNYNAAYPIGLQGVLHQKLGQHLTAISFLRQALDLLDGKPPIGMLPAQVRKSLAISLADQQQWDDAITVATENLGALDQDPRVLRKETVIALTELGRLHLEKGEPALALPHLERARSIALDSDAIGPTSIGETSLAEIDTLITQAKAND